MGNLRANNLQVNVVNYNYSTPHKRGLAKFWPFSYVPKFLSHLIVKPANALYRAYPIKLAQFIEDGVVIFKIEACMSRDQGGRIIKSENNERFVVADNCGGIDKTVQSFFNYINNLPVSKINYIDQCLNASEACKLRRYDIL